jgi:hypothetical protein
MQPFRAPRSRPDNKGSVQQPSDSEARAVKGSPTRCSPRRIGKPDTEVHVVPYMKGIRMLSERESQEMVQHGEVLRWSSGSEGEEALPDAKTDLPQQDERESEDPTELGVVWERYVIKETTEGDTDRIGEESEAKTDRDELDDHGSRWTIEARTKRAQFRDADDGTVLAQDSSRACRSSKHFWKEKLLRAYMILIPVQRPTGSERLYPMMHFGKGCYKTKSEDWRMATTLERYRFKTSRTTYLL